MKPLDLSFWPEWQGKPWMSEDAQTDLVSVIIPVFNRQVYILDAIESVYRQTYRPIEVLVVDDGSTDETAQAVNEWMDAHPNSADFTLRYHKQANGGVSSARNAGLLLSTGEYIQFLDSDDLLLPERLSKCVQAMKTHRVEFVYSAHYLDYSMEASEHQGRGLVVQALSGMGNVPDPRYYIWTVAGFFHRSVLCLVGPWNESLRICEDAEYFSRAFAVAESAYPIPEPLVIKRKHGGPRLLNVQREYAGLENRYRCIELRQRIVRYCGYHNQDFLGGWLQLAQDSLACGFPDICDHALVKAKNCDRFTARNHIRWTILKVFSYFPASLNKKIWPKVNETRNAVMWFMDMRKGKIQQASPDNLGERDVI